MHHTIWCQAVYEFVNVDLSVLVRVNVLHHALYIAVAQSKTHQPESFNQIMTGYYAVAIGVKHRESLHQWHISLPKSSRYPLP